MKTHKRFLVAASFALALAFTISCSSDDGDEDTYQPPSKANTYFYSIYGFTNVDFCNYMLDNTDENSLSDESLAGEEFTFEDVKKGWLELKTISGVTLESMNNYPESSLRNDLMISGGLAPSQVNAFMDELNKRKNSFIFGYSSDPRYCMLAMYFEKE
jgi:hypothetical protein